MPPPALHDKLPPPQGHVQPPGSLQNYHQTQAQYHQAQAQLQPVLPPMVYYPQAPAPPSAAVQRTHTPKGGPPVLLQPQPHPHSSPQPHLLQLHPAWLQPGTPLLASPKCKSKTQTVFIHKLYDMLEDGGIGHLIWWAPGGDAFCLVPGEEFSQVLAQYFKHTNIASFIRQLNMYGFHKMNDGEAPGRWEFRHAMGQFRRGDTALLRLIKRKLLKLGTTSKDVLLVKTLPPTLHPEKRWEPHTDKRWEPLLPKPGALPFQPHLHVFGNMPLPTSPGLPFDLQRPAPAEPRPAEMSNAALKTACAELAARCDQLAALHLAMQQDMARLVALLAKKDDSGLAGFAETLQRRAAPPAHPRVPANVVPQHYPLNPNYSLYNFSETPRQTLVFVDPLAAAPSQRTVSLPVLLKPTGPVLPQRHSTTTINERLRTDEALRPASRLGLSHATPPAASPHTLLESLHLPAGSSTGYFPPIKKESDKETHIKEEPILPSVLDLLDLDPKRRRVD